MSDDSTGGATEREPSLLARARELAVTASRTLRLVWETNRRLTLALVGLALAGALLPAAIAWVGKLIVDAVVRIYVEPAAARAEDVLVWVGVELGLVIVQQAIVRAQWLVDSLLRVQLGQRVNVAILEKALELELPDFESPEIADRMSRARRGASYRPLSFLGGAVDVCQSTIALAAYGVLLWQLAPWALIAVVLAALPVFVVETRFGQDAFRLFKWRAPETRKQNYLEWVLASPETVKEVKLFGLGPLFLGRYRAIYDAHYGADKARTVRQGVLGYAVGLLGTLVFYGTYGWVAWRTARGELGLGDMTLYLLVFRQAQGSLSSVLSHLRSDYEDLLYVSELFALLDTKSAAAATGGATQGSLRDDGLRFEDVGFAYPDRGEPVLRGVSLHLPPGHKLALVGENGAGKTTLIKLMTGLYQPTSGRITLDGTDLREWDPLALRKRIGVIFQDFVRYQLLVGENIGVGDVDALEDRARWETAAKKGLAHETIAKLPKGYETQLGRWFEDGQDLSVGQWQKVALARAFMREGANILVLDEPTASMDAEAEMQVFGRFRALAESRMAILISHRFSTVRMADTIAVLHEGQVVEHDTHETLLALGGRYARLFALQAQGYR